MSNFSMLCTNGMCYKYKMPDIRHITQERKQKSDCYPEGNLFVSCMVMQQCIAFAHMNAV